MIFVDTGAWFAAFVPNDPDHRAADAWLAQNRQPLVTTDYVLDELLTLLKRRGEYERALRLGPRILSGAVARLEWVTPADIQAASPGERNDPPAVVAKRFPRLPARARFEALVERLEGGAVCSKAGDQASCAYRSGALNRS